MANIRVLISGASIAGPALTHWLSRRGADVTVVEQTPGLRPGGQAVDEVEYIFGDRIAELTQHSDAGPPPEPDMEVLGPIIERAVNVPQLPDYSSLFDSRTVG